MNSLLLVLACMGQIGYQCQQPTFYQHPVVYQSPAIMHAPVIKHNIMFSDKIVSRQDVRVKFGNRIIQVPVINGYLPSIKQYKDGRGEVYRRDFSYNQKIRYQGQEIVQYSFETQKKTEVKKTNAPEKPSLPEGLSEIEVPDRIAEIIGLDEVKKEVKEQSILEHPSDVKDEEPDFTLEFPRY
jgi:hypothetical protein